MIGKKVWFLDGTKLVYGTVEAVRTTEHISRSYQQKDVVYEIHQTAGEFCRVLTMNAEEVFESVAAAKQKIFGDEGN